MEEVERRATTEQQLVAQSCLDLAKELSETKDGFEWPCLEAALARNACEVAAVRESVHAPSGAARRRCAGTMTFQRRTTLPPRVPGSR